MGQGIQWVADQHSVAKMVERLKGHSILAFDTEFIRETTFFPKIALLQVATREEAWLVDPTVLSVDDLKPLLDVLADPDVLKIVHAAYADQECLFWSYDLIAEPVLDTAVAAALTGYGDNVGLGKLLKEVVGVQLPKGRARVKWLQRPLSKELLTYAEQDVAHLVELGEKLKEKLEKRGRLAWAMEESKILPSAFDVPAEDMARRMAKSAQMDGVTLSALTELLRWREDRARRANLPRGWVADNDILVALAKVRPRSLEELRSFRGLNAKEVERSGRDILEAVAHGIENPVAVAPVERPTMQDREDHVFDFVRTYVSFLADRHAIALRFLINTAKATVLVAHGDRTPEQWVEEGILSPQACSLIGEELKALLSGQRGLVLRNGKVEILKLSP
jgi:ribonuclease D